MDKSTIIGLVMGFTLIIASIAVQGSVGIFLDLASFLIVIGGVYSAAFSNFGISDVNSTYKVLLNALPKSNIDPRTDIEILVMFAKKIRKNGMLSIEDDVGKLTDRYLQNGLISLIDGLEPETVTKIMENQLRSYEELLDRSVLILAKKGEYAPGFGMIGTIIGLVIMLQNMSDPAQLGAGMSVALLTTLYGSVLQNMIFTPLSGKLEFVGSRELNRQRMCQMAIESIIREDNPRIMESKLINLLAPDLRAEYIEYYEKNKPGRERDELMNDNWVGYQNGPWEKIKKDLATLG